MTQPARILIVDDEVPARRRLSDLLDDCREQFPLVIADEAAKEAPMHIDVKDLTFGYAGREVGM